MIRDLDFDWLQIWRLPTVGGCENEVFLVDICKAGKSACEDLPNGEFAAGLSICMLVSCTI